MTEPSKKKPTIFSLLRKVAKYSSIFIFFIFVLALILCVLGILPNSPYLENYGIHCKCNESSTNLAGEIIHNKIQISNLSTDTTILLKKIADLQEQMKILDNKYRNAIIEKEQLEQQMDSLNNQVAELTLQLSNQRVQIDSLKFTNDSLKDILASQGVTFDKNLQDTISYYKIKDDSLLKVNLIINNLRIVNLKAYTDRKSFLSKTRVTKINISYTITGINVLRENLKTKALTVFFKIKDKNGNYREIGEKNPSTGESEHSQLFDVIVFDNVDGDFETKEIPFPNWQTPFNILDIFTIEAYAQINGISQPLGSVSQNLKLDEKLFSEQEMTRKRK